MSWVLCAGFVSVIFPCKITACKITVPHTLIAWRSCMQRIWRFHVKLSIDKIQNTFYTGARRECNMIKISNACFAKIVIVAFLNNSQMQYFCEDERGTVIAPRPTVWWSYTRKSTRTICFLTRAWQMQPRILGMTKIKEEAEAKKFRACNIKPRKGWSQIQNYRPLESQLFLQYICRCSSCPASLFSAMDHRSSDPNVPTNSSVASWIDASFTAPMRWIIPPLGVLGQW